MDFLVPLRGGKLALLEVKWSKTPTPKLAEPLRRLLPDVPNDTLALVVHRGSRTLKDEPRSLGQGIQAWTVDRLAAELSRGNV